MAFPNITLVYTVPQGGAPAGDLQAAVASVAVPKDVLDTFGIRLISDATVIGPPVVRTIHLSAVPAVNAIATCKTAPMLQGTPIVSVTVTAPGRDFILPPTVLFADPLGAFPHLFDTFLHPTAGKGARAQAYLALDASSAVSAGGAGYSAQTTLAFIGGFPLGNGRRSTPPELVGADPPAGNGIPTTRTSDKPDGGLCVGSVGILQRGKHYDPLTTVSFLGTPAPGGTVATGVPVFGAKGSIVGVRLTNAGSGYVTAPQVIFNDPNGPHPDAPLHPLPDTLQSDRFPNAPLARATASMVRGRPARATLTIGGGVLTGYTLDDPGDGYVAVPTPVLFDPTGVGVGGAFTTIMNVGRIDMLNGGSGYKTPVPLLIPAYEAMFLLAINKFTAPAAATALLPFVNLMAAAIQRAAATPVAVSLPS
jgi:hypothetical protein